MLSNDYLAGEDGNDVIKGGDGNDYLTGGASDDFYRPGSGDDVVYNWEGGNDTLVLEKTTKNNFGHDILSDYDNGDTIEFKGYTADELNISSNKLYREEFGERYNEETDSWEYCINIHEYCETVFDFADRSRLSVSGAVTPQVGVDYFFT